MKILSGNLLLQGLWRTIGGTAVVILVAIGIWWWIGSAPSAKPNPAAAPPAPASVPSAQTEVPFLQVEGSQMAGVDPAGKKQWELRAKSVKIDRDKQMVTFATVTGQLYQAGTPRLAFEAPSGVFFIASRDVELSGGVYGRTSDGRTLRAAHLRWDAAGQHLIGSGGIVLTEPGMTVTADSVIADPGLRQTTFTGNIKVRLTQ